MAEGSERVANAVTAATLTARQLEVVALAAQGLRNDVIAERLAVPYYTVGNLLQGAKNTMCCETMREMFFRLGRELREVR